MFFSKRAFNSLSSSSRCSADKSFLLLLMFRALVALIVVASRVSYLLLRCAPPHGGFFGLSLRSYQFVVSHAVRSTPVSTSSLAAARRICVCPIFPQPPGIGGKISGALLHKRRLLLQRKHQISVPPACEASEANFLPPTRKARAIHREYFLFSRLQISMSCHQL